MRNQFDYFHVNVHVVLYFLGGNIPRFANNNLNVTNFQNQELFETAYAGFKRWYFLHQNPVPQYQHIERV